MVKETKSGDYESLRSDIYFTRGIVVSVRCDECGFLFMSKDRSRGEVLCPHCGVVKYGGMYELADPIYFGRWENNPLRDGSLMLRVDEKRVLARVQKRRYHTPKDEWRRGQYLHFAGVVIRHFGMWGNAEQLFLIVVRDYNLKLFHTWLCYEKVILGIAVEILRREGRLIPYSDKFVRKHGLNKVEQKVIRQNMHKQGVFK